MGLTRCLRTRRCSAPEWKLDRVLLCRFVGSLGFRNPDVLRTRVFADVFCAFGCQAGPFYSMRVLHFSVAPRCCSGRCKGFAVVLVVFAGVRWFDGLMASPGGAVVNRQKGSTLMETKVQKRPILSWYCSWVKYVWIICSTCCYWNVPLLPCLANV